MRKISTWTGIKTSLLHIAAGCGCEFCIPYFLSLGAKVDVKDAVYYFFMMEGILSMNLQGMEHYHRSKLY